MNSGSPGRRERGTPASARAAAQTDANSAPADEPSPPPAQRSLVLTADDERSVRMALRRYFERTGWQVEEAEDGVQALSLLARSEAAAYRLVISDVRMPGRTGLEVHDWLARERPELFSRLLIATGDVASPEIRAFVERTTRPVLEKPFELSRLAELVERVVGK